ncbi:MAG: hypothetical protein CM15mP49_35470 [Actinomycetota bacterium]|nr:MAG: hypothetical protein CM15mP49_35470 [Actinomycetota bacterium]
MQSNLYRGTIVTIAASGDDGVSIDGTTLKAFNSSTFEISGSGFYQIQL